MLTLVDRKTKLEDDSIEEKEMRQINERSFEKKEKYNVLLLPAWG